MKNLFIYSFPLILLSCGDSSDISESNTSNLDTLNNSGELVENPESVIVNFDLFDLHLKDYKFYGEMEYNDDTVSIYEAAGEGSFDSLEMSLIFEDNSNSYDSISIVETFHDCIVISGEGPWVTLEEWKSSSSQIFEMKKLEDSKYLTKDSRDYQSNWNPEFTKEDLLTAIYEYSDSSWARIVLEPYCEDWPDCYYGTGTYKRTIVIKLFSEEEITTRILQVFIPLGC
jgi:hypothetical protein